VLRLGRLGAVGSGLVGCGRQAGCGRVVFGVDRLGRHGGDGYGKVWLVEAGEAGNG